MLFDVDGDCSGFKSFPCVFVWQLILFNSQLFVISYDCRRQKAIMCGWRELHSVQLYLHWYCATPLLVSIGDMHAKAVECVSADCHVAVTSVWWTVLCPRLAVSAWMWPWWMRLVGLICRHVSVHIYCLMYWYCSSWSYVTFTFCELRINW